MIHQIDMGGAILVINYLYGINFGWCTSISHQENPLINCQLYHHLRHLPDPHLTGFYPFLAPLTMYYRDGTLVSTSINHPFGACCTDVASIIHMTTIELFQPQMGQYT